MKDKKSPEIVCGSIDAPRHLIGWQTSAYLSLTSRCGDRTLLIALQPLPGSMDWQLIALETVVEGGIESVLSDHAHKNLGKVSGVLSGIAKAEKYAAAWQTREEELRCDCVPIRKMLRTRKRVKGK